jgi:hypothetical protein
VDLELRQKLVHRRLVGEDAKEADQSIDGREQERALLAEHDAAIVGRHAGDGEASLIERDGFQHRASSIRYAEHP